MLFVKWDKSRGIQVTIPFEAHLYFAVAYLALSIFTHPELQTGVTERDLVRLTADYLLKYRFEDRPEAEKAAKEFIEFCAGRAWVFTDMGTTAEGERIFQFTHRTFLEYFTAHHLVRTHRTPKELKGALLPRLLERARDVVAQIAFQLQNKNIEGAGDNLLRLFLSEANTRDQCQKFNILSFAARCLEFLVPSPPVLRQIVETCINSCIGWSSSDASRVEVKRRFLRGEVGPRELMQDLLLSLALGENRDLVGRNLERCLAERITKGGDRESTLAVE
ncbi:MAG: hypothetical protein HYU64_15200, partial [Armatimonadetes bacterium]|nr:hypothetical protein [Armatimonadota bacterium]